MVIGSIKSYKKDIESVLKTPGCIIILGMKIVGYEMPLIVQLILEAWSISRTGYTQIYTEMAITAWL